ncbi:MAG: bifunctional phosphopantothenoylcysteine decarboxylase/phosphopantothenate--cysteine ligase CoaBC [Candidatus Bipolaricaulota bacterium]
MNYDNPLTEKTIAVAVTGGIAAYKAVYLVRELQKEGAEVRVLMTRDAEKFVGKVTFESLIGSKVYDDMFQGGGSIPHIELAKEADMFIVAPATMNTIGKIANGIGDNLLTATIGATKAPVLFCPSMHDQMYRNTATQRNLNLLRDIGHKVMDPEEGALASGQKGKGRLPSPEAIVEEAKAIAREGKLLAGKKVLITAGPTAEHIDPIRMITNRSSGRMGYALATQARDMGADVLLVSGPTDITPPPGVGVIRVESAAEMEKVVLGESENRDLVLMAAAVSDWKPKETNENKLKKEQTQKLELELQPTQDILKKLGKKKSSDQVLVGFAAESTDLEAHAECKLREKNLNAIFANPITEENLGPGEGLNRGILLFKSGAREEFPVQNKRTLARGILQELASRFYPPK